MKYLGEVNVKSPMFAASALESQSIGLGENFRKKYYFAYCLFTQICLDN